MHVQALYNLNTKFLESDFAFLHKLVKTNITQRSLLILFTNFESITALNRQLPYLRSISQKHLLLVVFFENTSIQTLAAGHALNVERLYEKVIAEKFILEKKLIIKELQQYGIAALLKLLYNQLFLQDKFFCDPFFIQSFNIQCMPCSKRLDGRIFKKNNQQQMFLRNTSQIR